MLENTHLAWNIARKSMQDLWSLQTLIRTQVTTYTWCEQTPSFWVQLLLTFQLLFINLRGKAEPSVFQTLLPSCWWLLYAVLIKQLNLHVLPWEDMGTRADLSLWIASLSHYEAATVFSPWTFKNAETEMFCDSEWNNFDVTRNVIKNTADF